MEYLEFLKYGAIGIALALAVLSYNLLSKEQDKPKIRPSMLKTIKTYFGLALGLSLFFGVLEVLPMFVPDKNGYDFKEIDRIWGTYVKNNEDSTYQEKLARIEMKLKEGPAEVDPLVICEDVQAALDNCKQKLSTNSTGFYASIASLRQGLNKDPDGWSRLDHLADQKGHLFDPLRQIFSRLGQNVDELSNEQLVENWKELKGKWTDTQLNYLFGSDIGQIVRSYLETIPE
jgi:hypothetical protein